MRGFLILSLLPLSGCTFSLPEISPNHPAHADAPAGQVYATPAVLEVSPATRPPDRPTTHPAHPYSHQSHGMTPMGEMPVEHEGMTGTADHAGRMDPTDTLPAPSDPARSADGREGKSQRRVQREGQLHE